MTQFPAPKTVQADFRHVILTNADTRFILNRTNDQFWVHMEKIGTPPGENAPVPSIDARIGLVTGSHHMQVFWLPSEQGNAQVGFPFTWLIPEKRWVPRQATFIRPPDSPPVSELWNVICSRCHTTAVEPRVDSVHYIADTQVGEMGIACEACHGPGERHVKARRSARESESVSEAVLRTEIVHPRKIDPLRASQICGFCHSMKWFDKSEGWWEHGFRYRPGDDLEQTTPIIRPSRVDSIPGLAAWLERNPELLRDFFWSDGMVRVSGRDYNGLIESPCFKGGHFSCLSCHSLHQSDPDGLVAQSRTGDQACLQCHEPFATEPKILAHTHHRSGSPGSACYNCHMPRTTYGVLKAIRSHQISSPNVADELATGRPNACNLCHLDKTLAWTADTLARWYGQKPPALSPDQTSVADAVRLALAGDAGQRVLVAWHFGWAPAGQVSGTDWMPPVLGQLLDDPYAAVRCVAERSLKRVSPFIPPEYDFTVSPELRPLARTAILGHWIKGGAPRTAPPKETLVQERDPARLQQAFDRLLQERDNRPVRLRE